MKSKRAEEFIGDTYLVGHPAFPIRIDIKNDLVKAVELAEQDTEEQYQDDLHHYQLMMNDTCSEMIDERDEEITSYRKELEESKRREELACKVIDDQRKKIEVLKARTVEAHRKCCFFRNDSTNECANTGTQCGEHSCFYMDVFIQKLNER